MSKMKLVINRKNNIKKATKRRLLVTHFDSWQHHFRIFVERQHFFRFSSDVAVVLRCIAVAAAENEMQKKSKIRVKTSAHNMTFIIQGKV